MSVKTPKSLCAYYDSERFEQEYTYDGPLGPDYAPEGTRLRLWAPTAEQVMVNLYRQGDRGFCIGSLRMERRERGCWTLYLPGDQHGLYYTFTVTANGATRETGDPYARAAGVNGLRSMIVDLSRTDPSGWRFDRRPFIPPARRVIWEVSVRDFSWDTAGGFARPWRGKYLAFTQEGTTLAGDNVSPTGLNYLRRLGVSHIQLMPVFDFGSVDESRPLRLQYNWGYDPVNYNLPEGSYSTDPYHGEVRIREFKQMVAALHKAGFGVVMDVVYNHMYRRENVLNDTVPYYYFRQNPDGTLSNGSGCGNEFACERPMARRYLIDSVLYWAREYHIDGFRFDLMGLFDVDTMNMVRRALDKLPRGEEILLYGEPWQGGASMLRRYEATKNNLQMLSTRIGVFSDDTRDAVKGSCFDAEAPGYVQGRPDAFWDIGAAVGAWCLNDRVTPRAPSQIISYISAHDNMTLWDKLLAVRYKKPDWAAEPEVVLAQNRLAAGIYLTCMGTPFMQAGEEFARTKRGAKDSYRAPAALNQLDWTRAAHFRSLVDYYRGLIALRARFPRLGDGKLESAHAISFFSLEPPLEGWQLRAAEKDGAEWGALAVFYNPTEREANVPLPAGRWRLLCDGVSSSLWRGEAILREGSTRLLPLSATIFGLYPEQ